MSIIPCVFQWDGEHMVPLPRFVPLCNRQYVVGERYRLGIHEDQSAASRGHYYAKLKEIWDNLKDEHAVEFYDVGRLRKWALCRTEYRNVRKIVCSSNVEARRIAAFIKTTDVGDAYVEVSVHGNVVVEITPKSQSLKAMGHTAFQDSKTKVLDICADLIDVTQKELADNAGRAA